MAVGKSQLSIVASAEGCVPEDVYSAANLVGDARNDFPVMHLQWLGHDVTSENAEIVRVIYDALFGDTEMSEDDLTVHATGSTMLSGMKGDTLVCKCIISKKLENLIVIARRRVEKLLPELGHAEFSFVPRLAIGWATKLPKNGVPPFAFKMHSLFGVGNDGVLRWDVAVR